MYTVILAPDEDGTVLVTCPDLPEVTTFGEDEEDAMQRAADAVEESLATRIARREDIPAPSPRTVSVAEREHGLNSPAGVVGLLTVPSSAKTSRRVVQLSPLTTAKVELYRAARTEHVSKAELARRLGWQGPQVDRLFDLNHRSRIDHIDQALRVIGKRLVVSVQDAA